MSCLYTIGFAGKDAKTFFSLLHLHGIKSLIDVRLNNVSQLAGYTKKNGFPRRKSEKPFWVLEALKGRRDSKHGHLSAQCKGVKQHLVHLFA